MHLGGSFECLKHMFYEKNSALIDECLETQSNKQKKSIKLDKLRHTVFDPIST